MVSAHRVEHWREEARLWLRLEDDGVSTLPRVASYQEVAAERSEESWENRVGFLVLDECDRVSMDLVAGVLRAVPAGFVLGLQEALRDDGLEPLLESFVGPLLYRAAPPRAPLLDVVLQHTAFQWTPDATVPPPARRRSLLKALSLDPDRNDMVVRAITAEAADGRSCLVFAVSREHADALADRARAEGASIAVLVGTVPPGERARIVRDFQEKRTSVLIVVEPRFGAGIDCPHLSRVLLATPVTATQLRQCLQPLLRPTNTESLPRVHDFVDAGVEELAAMAGKRREVYRREHTTLNPEAMQMELPFGEEDSDESDVPPPQAFPG